MDRSHAKASSARCCDFCGEPAARVRRVALDRGYNRLGVQHRVKYACDKCSAEKENARAAAGSAERTRG
jgi:hypothetical protein